MYHKKQIFLSLSDCLRSIKRMRFLLLAVSLLCGCVAFVYSLLQPITFTAQSVFNSKTAQPPQWIKALEFLGKEDTSLADQDHLTMMKSYPVLAATTRHLNLQATLQEARFGERFSSIYYTLKTAKTYARLKKEQPPSRILAPDVYTTSSLILPDKKSPIDCKDVLYTPSTSRSLKIQFLNSSTFRVLGPKKELGIGQLDLPFVWSEGSFTLSGKGKKGKKMTLHLLPLEVAVKSLQKTLRVAKNKENRALIEVSYTHKDRHLATDIVNSVMEQYQNYLAAQGKEKIEKQLLYLKQRQKDSLAQLEEVLENQKTILENDLQAGNILTLESELAFVAQQQSAKHQALLEIHKQMQSLARMVLPESVSQDQLMEFLRRTRDEIVPQVLNVETAHSQITQLQQQREGIRLDLERYDFCLQKLYDPEFDSSSLAKTLQEDFLRARFDKMNTIHHHLVDPKNWTGKEREQLKEELETEKRFMIQHISHLKEGALLQGNILKERILGLQKDLLYLLLQEHEHVTAALKDLNTQAAHFPQKWLNEQKIKIHSTLDAEMMSSLTKLVEAKNIGYHIDYLMPAPLQKAIAPVLPRKPYLGLCFLLGSCGTLVFSIVGICLYHAYTGPTASRINLEALGKQVLPQEEFIPRFGKAVTHQGKVIYLASRHKIDCVPLLIQWLEKKGERIFTIDLSQNGIPEEESDRDAYFVSDRFKGLLSKNYDRIFIISRCSATSFEMETLSGYADGLFFGVSDEKMGALESLPEKTLFFIQKIHLETAFLHQLGPKLDKLMKKWKYFSFSSLKRVWERFPLKKS